jgi:hypothetical protein
VHAWGSCSGTCSACSRRTPSGILYCCKVHVSQTCLICKLGCWMRAVEWDAVPACTHSKYSRGLNHARSWACLNKGRGLQAANAVEACQFTRLCSHAGRSAVCMLTTCMHG